MSAPVAALTSAARDDAADRLLARPARLGSCRLLTIDGPAGSGKTSLGYDLERVLHGRGLVAWTVHFDDLYDGWTGLDSRLEERVVTQILTPLADGRAARWQRYDWTAGHYDDWVDLPVPQVLILEGCGSGARAYDAWRSLLVWLEADLETRVRRGVERDGEQVRDHWTAWMSLEQRHFAANDTRARADVRLRSQSGPG